MRSFFNNNIENLNWKLGTLGRITNKVYSTNFGNLHFFASKNLLPSVLSRKWKREERRFYEIVNHSVYYMI